MLSQQLIKSQGNSSHNHVCCFKAISSKIANLNDESNLHVSSCRNPHLIITFCLLDIFANFIRRCRFLARVNLRVWFTHEIASVIDLAFLFINPQVRHQLEKKADYTRDKDSIMAFSVVNQKLSRWNHRLSYLSVSLGCKAT